MWKTVRQTTGKKPPSEDAPHSRTVAICGDSVLLLTVGASLGPGVEVQSMPSGTPVQEMLRQVRESKVEAIIFELGPSCTDWAYQVLKSDPELVLVGVEWESDRAMVITSRSARAWTGDELLKAIEAGKRSVTPATRPATTLRS